MQAVTIIPPSKKHRLDPVATEQDAHMDVNHTPGAEPRSDAPLLDAIVIPDVNIDLRHIIVSLSLQTLKEYTFEDKEPEEVIDFLTDIYKKTLRNCDPQESKLSNKELETAQHLLRHLISLLCDIMTDEYVFTDCLIATQALEILNKIIPLLKDPLTGFICEEQLQSLFSAAQILNIESTIYDALSDFLENLYDYCAHRADPTSGAICATIIFRLIDIQKQLKNELQPPSAAAISLLELSTKEVGEMGIVMRNRIANNLETFYRSPDQTDMRRGEAFMVCFLVKKAIGTYQNLNVNLLTDARDESLPDSIRFSALLAREVLEPQFEEELTYYINLIINKQNNTKHSNLAGLKALCNLDAFLLGRDNPLKGPTYTQVKEYAQRQVQAESDDPAATASLLETMLRVAKYWEQPTLCSEYYTTAVGLLGKENTEAKYYLFDYLLKNNFLQKGYLPSNEEDFLYETFDLIKSLRESDHAKEAPHIFNQVLLACAHFAYTHEKYSERCEDRHLELILSAIDCFGAQPQGSQNIVPTEISELSELMTSTLYIDNDEKEEQELIDRMSRLGVEHKHQVKQSLLEKIIEKLRQPSYEQALIVCAPEIEDYLKDHYNQLAGVLPIREDDSRTYKEILPQWLDYFTSEDHKQWLTTHHRPLTAIDELEEDNSDEMDEDASLTPSSPAHPIEF